MNNITIQKDGDSWCALLGENLQDGVSGFGDTPQEALQKLMCDPEFYTWRWMTPDDHHAIMNRPRIRQALGLDSSKHEFNYQ